MFNSAPSPRLAILSEIERFLSSDDQDPHQLKAHADWLLTEVKALKLEGQENFTKHLETAQAMSVVRQQRDTLEHLAKMFGTDLYDLAQERTDLMWAVLNEIWMLRASRQLDPDSRLCLLYDAITAIDKRLIDR